MKNVVQYIDVEIDKLTNSIENSISGDSFLTEISIISKSDIVNITKSKGWLFDWKKEFKMPDRDVYKLTIINNPFIVQGLISISERVDHVYIHLIESAPFNLGKEKLYRGVPGNLFAFACRLSFHRGFDGYIAFTSKTNLINHYIDTLGAENIGGQLMVINKPSALRLINKYFKE